MSPSTSPFLVVLGITQDAGYPQAGCSNECCAPAWEAPTKRRYPSCVAVVDAQSMQRWIFDCTPCFPEQLHNLDAITHTTSFSPIPGIFLTHAHVGHYTGLIHLGREAMDAHRIPLYAMPRMETFLRVNAPWSQLVANENIEIRRISADKPVALSDRLTVTPLPVPHRDEFSETVAFIIDGPNRSVLYLPDIDSWEARDVGIEQVLQRVDCAFVDGTFFSKDELPGRQLAEIPHPLITDSLERFGALPASQRDKIHFLHFNHTNPALHEGSRAAQTIHDAGMHVAHQGQRCDL